MYRITKVLSASFKHWREISFIYLVQLCVGLVVGVVLCSSLGSAFDGSMAVDQLAKGFDRTVFVDLLNSNSDVLAPTRSIAMILGAVYLVTSIMLHAGWLSNIHKKEYTLKSFLMNGANLFLPFLGIAIMSIFLVLIFGGVVGITFNSIVGDPRVSMSSEKPYVIWIMVLIAVFVLWSILVWSWSVASRYHYIDGRGFGVSLKKGFKTVRTKILSFVLLGLLIIGVHVALMTIYYYVMGDRGAASWFIVFVGVILQQLFAFIRFFIRGFGFQMAEELSF